MANCPKVSIIILNWNNIEDTILCLESVFQMDYSNFDVIVIDNGSEEDPLGIIRQRFPQVVYHRNRSKSWVYRGK